MFSVFHSRWKVAIGKARPAARREKHKHTSSFNDLIQTIVVPPTYIMYTDLHSFINSYHASRFQLFPKAQLYPIMEGKEETRPGRPDTPRARVTFAIRPNSNSDSQSRRSAAPNRTNAVSAAETGAASAPVRQPLSHASDRTRPRSPPPYSLNPAPDQSPWVGPGCVRRRHIRRWLRVQGHVNAVNMASDPF